MLASDAAGEILEASICMNFPSAKSTALGEDIVSHNRSARQVIAAILNELDSSTLRRRWISCYCAAKML
jgi:hypothetical protein